MSLAQPELQRVIVGVSGLLMVTGACGSESQLSPEQTVALTEAGQIGREVFEQAGCGSCHGEDGAKGVGPSLLGLFGTEEMLEGGETVKVDAAYLERAIRDPSADRVEGFTIQMPTVNISDTELASILAYLEELK